MLLSVNIFLTFSLSVVQRVHEVVKDMIAEHKAHYTERKFIDIVLETGLDETTIYGDILVYLVGGFHSVSTSKELINHRS